MAVAGLQNTSTLDSYGTTIDKSTTRTSSIRKMWQDLESEGKCESMESEDTLNEIENTCPQNQNQIAILKEDDNKLRLQRSPSLEVPEKERVRKVFRDWGSRSFQGRMSDCSRVQSVKDSECKRVKIVSEWIESNDTEIGSQIEKVLNKSVEKSIRRIYGRQALLDLLAKFVKERKREVESLLENRFVSNFAHRHRIQSLLKGRFLRNQRFVEDVKQTSIAASELGLLRQTHAVSDIRKGFLSRLNNNDHTPEIQHSDSDNDIQYEQPEEIHDIFKTNKLKSNGETHNPQQFASPVVETHDHPSDSDTSSDNDIKYDNIQEVEEIPKTTNLQQFTCEESHDNIMQYEETEILPTTVDSVEIHEGSVSLHPLQMSTESLNWKEFSQAEEEWEESVTEDDESEWHHLSRTDSDEGTDVNSPVSTDSQDDQWYDNVQNETLESGTIMFRSNTFYWSDDDNDNKRFELRELTNRRRVSKLLQSDFGPRLDQLLQSYIDRQNQASESENESDIDTVDSPTVNLQIQGGNDLNEREIIDGLRIDMNKLQQRMDEIQKMVEACMDMQVELQKSMHQELNSALNPSLNSADACERKEGVCFLCRDDDFRSGLHMYICSQCAEKINWSKVKESVR